MMQRPTTLSHLLALAALLLVTSTTRAQTDQPTNLSTPHATVEHFLLAAREGNFERAAQALNLTLLPDADPAQAARQFYYVLNQELWIDWDMLPDRPDGMVDSALIDADPLAGKPRHNISIGVIPIDDREVQVRVQRTAPPPDTDQQARPDNTTWQFSANTVNNIPALYRAHGPSWLEQRLPDWANDRSLGRVAAWKWVALALLLTLTPVLGYLLTSAIKRAVRKVEPLPYETLDRYDWPLTAAFATFFVWVAISSWLSIPNAISGILEPLSFILFIFACAWFTMRAVDNLIDHLGQEAIERFHEDGSDSGRRVLTQITVVRHAAMLIVAIVAVGVVLVQLDLAKAFGISLLSSASVAAVILGIAGHAVLGNLIAGLQIALTQPFKIGDTVYIEDNWGTIERIAYTYVVVDTWDERRLVFPIRYFTSNWFENWSIDDTYLVKPIYLHLDYTAPVDKIREKFTQLVEADELHDDSKDDPETLVTDSREETLVVRLTCGAATPSDAWTLHCRVREQLVAWLQELDDGAYLPKRRLLLRESPADNRDDDD